VKEVINVTIKKSKGKLPIKKNKRRISENYQVIKNRKTDRVVYANTRVSKMMRDLYYSRDSKRGVEGTFNWLVDEVDELGEELKGSDKQAMEKEFADVIAWLASLANIMGVNLEQAALSKYNNKCPKCKQSPCQCPF